MGSMLSSRCSSPTDLPLLRTARGKMAPRGVRHAAQAPRSAQIALGSNLRCEWYKSMTLWSTKEQMEEGKGETKTKTDRGK